VGKLSCKAPKGSGESIHVGKHCKTSGCPVPMLDFLETPYVCVDTDCLPQLVLELSKKEHSTPYRIVTHNSDYSTPLAPKNVQYELDRLYHKKQLIAVHGLNSDWAGSPGTTRPPWLHCLPLGNENRHWERHLHRSTLNTVNAMRSLQYNSTALKKFDTVFSDKLLLVAFKPAAYTSAREVGLYPFINK
jgi:hypothetical protein